MKLNSVTDKAIKRTVESFRAAKTISIAPASGVKTASVNMPVNGSKST